MLLARALDQSAQYWLNLQATYDLKIAAAAIARQISAGKAYRIGGITAWTLIHLLSCPTCRLFWSVVDSAGMGPIHKPAHREPYVVPLPGQVAGRW
ncbi:MAG: hypothetical protein IPN92_11805 [Chromatiaceae bacterium]|nr:hypothetical protein [Chromatiaceae bacterium]